MTRTLVFQSADPAATPRWVAACLDSVRQWAEARGHAYRLLGNELFDPLPPGFTAPILPRTDLARLLWCARLLGESWHQVIWIDADIFVSDTASFAVDAPAGELLCRELWMWREDGELRARWAINNCVMAYRAESALLSFYIRACQAIAYAAPGGPGPRRLGPEFLTALGVAMPLTQIETVMTLSPLLIDAALAGDLALLANVRTLWNAPVHALHLCSSLADERHECLVQMLEGGANPFGG